MEVPDYDSLKNHLLKNHLLDQNVFDVMSNSIAALGTICRSSEDTSHDMSYAARRIRTGWHYYNNNYRLSSVN